jgi:hypothetical protein
MAIKRRYFSKNCMEGFLYTLEDVFLAKFDGTL